MIAPKKLPAKFQNFWCRKCRRIITDGTISIKNNVPDAFYDSGFTSELFNQTTIELRCHGEELKASYVNGFLIKNEAPTFVVIAPQFQIPETRF